MYKLYAFFDLDQLDHATLSRCMQLLPQERRKKALRYHREIDRKNCVAAYLLGVGMTQSLSDIDITKLHNKIPTFTKNGSCIAMASAEFFQEESLCLS